MQAILYQDEEWLAVDKPTGLNSHAARNGGNGAAQWLELHLGCRLHLFSRLDQGTSGLLLFARTRQACARAEQVHGREESIKRYHLLSDREYLGEDGSDEWEVDLPLEDKSCRTSFRLIRKARGYFLYQAEITRGRTHQIRRHAAHCGIPIVGDGVYGGACFSRLCLHCSEVRWPFIKEVLSSPLPDSFSFLLAGKPKLLVDGAVASERRKGWPGLVTDCCRLVHRGELELPVSIDLYKNLLHIISFDEHCSSEKMYQRLQPILKYLEKHGQIQGGVLRSHLRNPHQKKLIHDVMSFGEVPKEMVVQEHGIQYTICLRDDQHPGLFLDQRDSRRRIQLAAEEKRVANLFSFTCSFSLAALAGGAEVSFSVDLAASALKRGKNNFQLNGYDKGSRGKFVVEDVLRWLDRQLRKQEREQDDFKYWDIIICDPPVFASAGKGRGFHVEKQWAGLAEKIRRLLAEDGLALFANNHRSGDSNYYHQILQRHFRTVTPIEQPFDFPQLSKDIEHVRIYWCSN